MADAKVSRILLIPSMLFPNRKIRRRRITLVVLLLLLVSLFCFRDALLRGAGNVLISEDQLEKSDAIAVLGGNSYDRGLKGAVLYSEQWANTVICTGGNHPLVLEAVGQKMNEAEVSKSILLTNEVPDDAIVTLTTSTSTYEEALELLKYCQENETKQLIVVSSLFHLTRVKMIFNKVFESSGVELLFSGASSSAYDEENWWKSEAGLIMVNNEYVKLMYYLVKY